jgi:tRNA nucleotidyltransferase (CCA-adding enzyme)
MNCTKILPNIQNQLAQLLENYSAVVPIIQSIVAQEGQVFMVGGAVRDLLLAVPVYDIDLEVHMISLEKLASILSTFGPVSYVGKSFGILKLHSTHLGLLDWALPRSDSSGRKPEVTVDPYMGIENALRRRDLTINALAINLTTGELIDPFCGYQDIVTRTLRSPDVNFFTEDPLRFFRVMQFISRLQMLPDRALNSVCATMDISTVSVERIELEYEKLLLKSEKPSLGIRWLAGINRLAELLPELDATYFTPQEYEWHPEGTVFEHSMQTVDAAARFSYDSEQQKLCVLYAALLHDVGKATTTTYSNGRIRSLGHDDAGAPLAKALLKRITRKNYIIDTVPILVKNHMQPFNLSAQNSSLAAYKRLALRLAPRTNIKELVDVARADKQGRNKLKGHPLEICLPSLDIFIERAQAAGVFMHPEKPLLQGKDVEDLVQPGPLMGKALHYAYDVQINKNIQDISLLKKFVEQLIKNYTTKITS